jgi:heptosyltransferase-3
MRVKGNTIESKNIHNILLIQLGDIGDVVLSYPCIRTLKENFPKAKIIVAVREKAGELIDDCPWATGGIFINNQKRKLYQEISYQKEFFYHLRKFRFDLAVDLRTGTRGAILALLSGARQRIGRFADDGRLWRNRIFTHLVSPSNELNQYAAEHNINILSPLNLNIKDRLPVLSVSHRRREMAMSLLRREKIPLGRPIVAVHPFSLWNYKEWGIKEFISLIDYIGRNYNYTVVITGSKEERNRAEVTVKRCKTAVFNLAGKTSIGTLPAVFEACNLFIGVDTAALHIAAAVGIPTIGIFGPSSPINWAPIGDQHTVVFKEMLCLPCRRKGCQDSETSRCLDELTFEEIKETVDGQLKSISAQDSIVSV